MLNVIDKNLKKWYLISMSIIIGIIFGAATMLFYFYSDLIKIRDFGQCLEERSENIEEYYYLSIMAVSDCYNLYANGI